LRSSENERRDFIEGNTRNNSANVSLGIFTFDKIRTPQFLTRVNCPVGYELLKKEDTRRAWTTIVQEG